MAVVIDLVNEALSVNALAPASYAATAQGASQDFTNGEISTNLIVDVGAAVLAATGNINVQCEESQDGATNWTVIPGMVVTVTAGSTHVVTRGQRTHRYCRANMVTFSATSALVSADIVAQKKISGTGGGFSRLPSS